MAIFKELRLRNFKSYGNNQQVLKFNTETGALNLLIGDNGNGKSALIEAMEYVLYNKVKGKKEKWTNLSSLPNRINKELDCGLSFISNENVEIEIERGRNPLKVKLLENGSDFDKAGKGNVDAQIEKHIGIDIETFKSFISMSINNFKNFINLSNEEKKLLLDKLFNMEVINVLNGILKGLVKDNNDNIKLVDREIDTLTESIEQLKQSIEKVKKEEASNIDAEIESIKKDGVEKKKKFDELTVKIQKIQEKDTEISVKLEKDKSQYITHKSEINTLQTKIDLYDSGKCPTCESDLTTALFSEVKESLNTQKKTLQGAQVVLEKSITHLKEGKEKLGKLYQQAKTAHDNLKFELQSLKSKLNQLVAEKGSKDNTTVAEFENMLSSLEVKKEASDVERNNYKDKEIYFKEISNILGENGVKKSIIRNIIQPINVFIQDNLNKMRMPYIVELDETFEAKISQFGYDVEHESLSTGETKKINIAIMIAYLKVIRTKRTVNVLFLDEVFASIDISGINDILDLLKSFALEYNINIFLVHHALLNREYFDRIIRVNKDVFSSLEEYTENE